MIRIAVVASVLFGACISQPPQPAGATWSWQQHAGADQPGPMRGARLTYDAVTAHVVMYSGMYFDATNTPIATGKTWQWDGDSWTEICTGSPPAPKFQPAFAFDPRGSGTLVLAGGSDNADLSAPSSAVYGCDGTTWTLLGSIGADGRVGSEMVFDTTRGELVLVGGRDTTAVQLGTVMVSMGGPATWQTLASTSYPTGGLGTEVAYDADNAQLIAVQNETQPAGTTSAASDYVSDLGSTITDWIPLCDACTGELRFDAAIVHATGYDQTFLLNGHATADLAGSWVFDNAKFVQFSDDLPARDAAGVAYDEQRKRVVSYGGDGCAGGDCADTWELVPSE